LQVQFRLQITLRLFAPFAKTHPSFAPRCAPALPAAGVTYPPPVPRTGPPTYTTGSDTGSGQRIRHGLRIVCRRLCPPYRLGARTHRNAPLSRSRRGGIYPNPRRPGNVALKGSFCVGLLPAPGGCGPLPPLPELPPLPSCPPLLPRCWSCPMSPCCPGHVRDGVRRSPGSGPDQPDQPDQKRQWAPDRGPATTTPKML
jgi:hypothetical protein